MNTTFEMITKGSVTEANFVSSTFEESSANDLAIALMTNSSVVKLNFTLSDLNDQDFGIIAKCLRERSTTLYELNIDLTYVSINSLQNLAKLISSRKVSNILMYQIKGIHQNPEIISSLSQLAKKSNVDISFDHPHERQKNGFFTNQNVTPIIEKNEQSGKSNWIKSK